MGGVLNTFYIFFCNEKVYKWRKKILLQNEKHCFAAKSMKLQDGTEYLLTLENLYSYIDTNFCFLNYKEICENVPNISSCIEYYTDINPKNNILFDIISCVTVIKKLLGINNIFIQTPNQLKNYLLKKGGKVIWELYLEKSLTLLH